MRRSILFGLLAAASLASGVASAAVVTAKITNDTYVDSYTLDGRYHQNFGASAAVKAISNLSSGSASNESSTVHGLFTLPNQFWSDIGSGPVTSPVTVTFNMRNNSLARNPPASGYRQLEMLPLKQGFVTGTGGNGGSTSAGSPLNGTPNTSGVLQYYGTDWITVDGKTPWTTAGGTFDTAVPPITTTTPITNTGSITATGTTGQTVATWDITSWINDATLRNEIKTYGLLVRVTDETSFTGNEFASFVSGDGGATAGTYFGLGPSITYVPEPTIFGVAGVVGTLTLRRRRSV